MIEDPYLGKYITCVSARSTDKEILQKAQDGGIATTLMVYALEQGIIDGTIVAGEGDRPWQPRAVRRDEPRGHPQGTRDEVQHQPPDLLAQGGDPVLRPRQGRGHRRLLPDAGGQEGSALSHQHAGCPGQDRLHSRALLHGKLPVQVHADDCRGPRGPEPQLREEDGDREGQVLGLHRARERRHPAAQG